MEDLGRRAFLRLLLLSAFAHGLAVSALIAVPFLPSSHRAPMLPVVTVDLLAPAPSRAKPAPAPRPAPTPAPKLAKKVLLPAKPRSEPKPAPKAPPKAEPEEYEDVLAKLREEQGEAAPEAAPQAVPAAPSATPAAGPGAPVGAEVRAWVRAARLHVSRAWLLAPGLRAQGLEAHVRVRLDARGNLVSDPEIARRSGNPWFDESLVRAIQKASPLPPPPEPGEWVFIFDPEVYL